MIFPNATANTAAAGGRSGGPTHVSPTFDDQWLQHELLAGVSLPPPLRATASEGVVRERAGAPELLAARQAEQQAAPRL